MRVLVADDDRVMSHMLASVFRARGWTVDQAASGAQALDAAAKNSPDAITLDIHMPGGTGLDALRTLKSGETTRRIPVVVISGSIDPDEEPAAMSLGAAAFVRKPCDPLELASLLTTLCGVQPQA